MPVRVLVAGPWVAPKKVQGSPGPNQHLTLGQRKETPLPGCQGPTESRRSQNGLGQDRMPSAGANRMGGSPGQAAS